MRITMSWRDWAAIRKVEWLPQKLIPLYHAFPSITITFNSLPYQPQPPAPLYFPFFYRLRLEIIMVGEGVGGREESVMEGNYNGKQRYFLEVIRQFSYVMLLSLQHSITFYSSLFLAFFLHSIPSRITFSFSLSFPSLSCGRYAQTRPLGRRMRAREGKDERKARNK